MSLPSTVLATYRSGTLDTSVVNAAVAFEAAPAFFNTLFVARLTGLGVVLALEASSDGGQTWAAATAKNMITGAYVSSVSTDGSYRLTTGGATHFQCRVTTASAGSVSLTAGGGSAPLDTAAQPPSQLATGQISVGTSATMIVTARAGRAAVRIVQEGTNLVRLGGPGVTMSSGVALVGTVGAQIDIAGGAAVYGIATSGPTSVSFLEAF